MDFVKINLDASFHANSSQGGWGAIARDSDDDVAVAVAGALTGLSSALHAEAIALLKDIGVAIQSGMGRVIFEMDCLQLQQALVSTTMDWGQLGILFREA